MHKVATLIWQYQTNTLLYVQIPFFLKVSATGTCTNRVIRLRRRIWAAVFCMCWSFAMFDARHCHAQTNWKAAPTYS